jgi:DNA-binding XRE family transcriptional regulator
VLQSHWNNCRATAVGLLVEDVEVDSVPIWEAMRMMRIGAGLTLSQAAIDAGISRRTLGLLERGRQVPTPWQAMQWAEALGVEHGPLRAWVDERMWGE